MIFCSLTEVPLSEISSSFPSCGQTERAYSNERSWKCMEISDLRVQCNCSISHTLASLGMNLLKWWWDSLPILRT